jgi:hypothetical protein
MQPKRVRFVLQLELAVSATFGAGDEAWLDLPPVRNAAYDEDFLYDNRRLQTDNNLLD